MVYIHGGTFTDYSADIPLFDGSNLANFGDVIVVTLNYRLGKIEEMNLNFYILNSIFAVLKERSAFYLMG